MSTRKGSGSRKAKFSSRKPLTLKSRSDVEMVMTDSRVFKKFLGREDAMKDRVG